MLLGTKADLVSLEKTGLVTGFIGFPALPVSEEGDFLAGSGTLGYLGDLRKRGIPIRSLGAAGEKWL